MSRRHTTVRQDWQEQAWPYYRHLPEIHYPANFFGSSLSRFIPRIGLVPADDPTAPPVVPEADNKDDLVKMAEEQLAALEGETGDIGEILFRYGVNMSVAGDGWLVGVDDLGGTNWEFLSVKEITFKNDGPGEGGRTIAMRNPTGMDDGTGGIELPAGAMLRRFWRPHAEYSYRADAAMESLLDDCERLMKLNDSINSRLINRLAQSGILYLPSELGATTSIQVTEPVGDGEPSDPLIRQLIAYFTAAVTDRSGATGAIPIIIKGPAAVAEALKHITLDRAIDEVELKLREETRQTIARGLDLPPEVQTGLQDASHWTSWSVMDSSYRNHLQPAADRFASGLTRVYIRPSLPVSEAEARRVAVVMDGSRVISRPNEAEDGRQLHDRLTISDTALRRRSGVSEEDEPDEEEYVRQLGRKTNNPFLATFGLDVHEKVDWDEVAKVGSSEGAPGVGSIPNGRRPADSSDPAGAPGEGDAGGVSDGEVQAN